MEHNSGAFVGRVVTDQTLPSPPIDMIDAREPGITQDQETTREASLTFAFLLGSENSRFSNMIDDI